jgi:DNA-binding PadR family transcriptional regulator
MPARRRTELRHPLSLSVVHILLALADGARHGYAIKQEVEQRSGGDVRLGPGTLYEAIQRLEDAGYIEETSPTADPENGQIAQRRYYQLTPDGWSVLRLEIRHLARLVNHARAFPRLRRPDPA